MVLIGLDKVTQVGVGGSVTSQLSGNRHLFQMKLVTEHIHKVNPTGRLEQEWRVLSSYYKQNKKTIEM